MRKILVLCKTHLDIGFTNFAAEITRQYNEDYIPSAIRVGEELKDRPEGFTWTTGSWLPRQYLKTAAPEAQEKMRKAIKSKSIRWHGLPATLHSEAASEALFEYGLGFSQELDREFGVKTIGAKFTDVPGHTVAIVPLLAKHGIQFLHIGVNAASTAPDVPDLFVWRAPTGEEVIVMYNKGDYGEFTQVEGTDTAVYFAHTNDNLGPQSSGEIIEIYDALHAKYSEAEIAAGDLNDVAELVLTVRDSLPVVTGELGDSWIYGTGTDPRKMNGYRGLLRAAEGWDEKDRATLFESLIMIPEHTWGLDEKTHLNDHLHFSREKFEAARNTVPFLKMEKSWQEQRDYLTASLQNLSQAHQKEALEILEEYRTPYPDLNGWEKLSGHTAEIEGWQIAFDPDGSISRLEKDGISLTQGGKLGVFLYEAFSEKEVKGFQDRYMTHAYDWALEDFGKIGLSGQFDEYYRCGACLTGAYRLRNRLLLTLAGDEKAHKTLGCPPKMTLCVTLAEDGAEFDFAWYDKPANRIPEGLWLGFAPAGALSRLGKLGTLIDPRTVVSKGNREMHCTNGQVLFEKSTLYAQDAPLLAIEKPSLFGFHDAVPATDKGVWFSLFNNQWGTNFPMWNEGDARFRFTIKP